MKTISLIISLLFFSLIMFAQDNRNPEEKPEKEIHTLLNNREHGGFGGVSIMYSEIAGQDALSMGGRGGWIIGHCLSLGFGGTGYFNNIQYISEPENLQINHAGGHGGIYLEPILLPRFPVHLSIPLFAGAGGITYLEYTRNMEEGIPIETQSYFIAEPGVELEFNMLKFFRIAAGVYYRYTTKINMEHTPANPLEGYKYGITLKFGKF